MKKQILAVVLLFGFSIAVEAQTLLYQWAFTNVSDTYTSSIPTYAITPATGTLGFRNVNGDAITPRYIFFTNANFGPPGGPGGALVIQGQTYGGNDAIATNSSLTLGTLYQFTITFWVQYGASMGQNNNDLPREVQFGSLVTYDAGNKGTGNHNGVGTALNGATGNPSTGYDTSFQDGIASATSPNFDTTVGITSIFTNHPPGTPGFVCDGQTWYFEALTYDSTLSSNNFQICIFQTNAVTQTGIMLTNFLISTSGGNSAAFGGINFTTNASVILAGCTGAGRNITDGQLSDIRLYSGIMAYSNMVAIEQFQNPILNTNNVPAIISAQPVSGNTFVSGTRSFSVAASGLPPLFTYLWTSNGVAVSGGTNATLTLSNVQFSANGAAFVCSVTNYASGIVSSATIIGGTNSLPATITVLTPASGSYAKAVLTNQPYSFWLVNEPTNNLPIVISDYANGNDGVAAFPTGDLFQSGPTNTIYVGFPTNDTCIETPANGRAGSLNTPALPVYNNTGMTICGWVYTPTTGNGASGANGLIFTLPSDTANGYGLVFGAGNELDYQWGNGNNTGSGLLIPSGEWTFVALVISTNLSQQDLASSITKDTNATVYVGSKSSGFSSYVDGTAFTGHLIVPGTSLSALALGRTTQSSSEHGGYANQSNVRFNDVAVFYSALSPQTINNLYLAGAGVPINDTWVGNLSSDWDTVTENWTSGGVPAYYSDGNAVFFNDTAHTGNINLPGNVSPSGVTVSNNVLAYAFGGGSIGGYATLTKQGTNVLILNGDHTYSGITTVGNGTLLVESSISSGVNIVGGTLGGYYGTIYGVVTDESGGTLAPGATLSTAGTYFTVGGLTLLPGSTTIMQVSHNSGSTLIGDQIDNTGTNNIVYGGTLIIVTNAGDATTYKVGDKVTLFNNYGSGGFSNSFASIQPPPGPGLAWSNDAVNLGQFDVIVAPPVTAPVAGFSGMPTNIFVTQTVVFTNTSTGSFTNSAWIFGDGNVTNTSEAGASSNMSHTYNTAGTNTVTLVVTGAGGSSTNTQTAYIVVKPKLAIGQPVLSSGSLILSGTNGPIGQQYRILTATNAALNVTNWIPVFTNVFTPPNGAYNYTNTALTNTASFFRLVSP
jgi:autotransporter-associated beta strand protein